MPRDIGTVIAQMIKVAPDLEAGLLEVTKPYAYLAPELQQAAWGVVARFLEEHVGEQHAKAGDRQRHAVANRFAEHSEGDQADGSHSARFESRGAAR